MKRKATMYKILTNILPNFITFFKTFLMLKQPFKLY